MSKPANCRKANVIRLGFRVRDMCVPGSNISSNNTTALCIAKPAPLTPCPHNASMYRHKDSFFTSYSSPVEYAIPKGQHRLHHILENSMKVMKAAICQKNSKNSMTLMKAAISENKVKNR